MYFRRRHPRGLPGASARETRKGRSREILPPLHPPCVRNVIRLQPGGRGIGFPRPRRHQEGVSELFTLLKVPLMLCPSVLMMVMQATRIRASMTAYSTAVGPSALTRNVFTLEIACSMENSSGNQT